MKILLLTSHPYDDPTYRTVLEGLAKAYARRGGEVAAAGQSSREPGRRAGEAAPWGRIHRLGGATPPGSAFRAVTTFFQLLPLLRGVELVHWHIGSERHGVAFAVRFACALSGAPYAVTLHSHQNPDLGPGLGWGRRTLGFLLAGARWVSAPSRSAVRSIAAAYPSLTGRLRVVPNGVDAEELAAAPAPSAPPRAFVLCVARLRRYKGIDVLLMAWKDCCAEFPDVDLVLCGGAQDDGYARLAGLLGLSSRVRFTGLLGRGDVWALIKSCRFLVLPSRYESFGLAALEAMACGKAVLATRCGGPEDFIEDGVSGLLVPAQDVTALALALRRLLSDASLRERLGAAARRVAAAYSWDAAAAALSPTKGAPIL